MLIRWHHGCAPPVLCPLTQELRGYVQGTSAVVDSLKQARALAKQVRARQATGGQGFARRARQSGCKARPDRPASGPKAHEALRPSFTG